MKLTYLCLAIAALCGACSKKTPPAKDTELTRIYFVARAVPGANIFSTNLKKELVRHTDNNGARDIDMTWDKQGNVFFTSNRVLPEDRAERAQIGRKGNRRQDLNVFFLPHDVREERAVRVAEVVEKTAMPESLATVSKDGSQFAFVRTQLPENNSDMPIAKVKKQAHDELYWKNTLQGEAIKIYEDDVIIKPDWSSDSRMLVFSSYSFKAKEAKLLLFDRDKKNVRELLVNPWESGQIDYPQWSPDGGTISLIKHPGKSGAARELYLFDINTKALSKISSDSLSVSGYISWSSDSQMMAFAALDKKTAANKPASKHIYTTDKSGSLSSVTTGKEGYFSTPVFSPDNTKIAYLQTSSARDRFATLKVMDLQGREIAELHENVFRKTRLFWQ